jgi:hypothetical protein
MVMPRLSFLFLLVVSASAFGQQAKYIQFREEAHDFGSVKESGGPVLHEFLFTNTANRPVKILNVQASCGCTTPDWSKEPVPPGKTGFIQASYDPKGRPGFFNKSLTVTTDYEANPIILQIKGIVSTEGVGSDADFQVVKGNWKFKSASLNMGKVHLNTEPTVRDFPFMNAGSDTVEVMGIIAPDYLTVEVTPAKLAPKERGHLKLVYDGKKKNQYGFQNDNLEIHTDDDAEPVKAFTVYATIEDYFGELKPEDMAKAPRLTLASSSMDFGRVTRNASISRELYVTNSGRSALTLNSIQPNCSCVTASADKTSLKPGERALIKITFHSEGRKSTQQKAITFYTNDPQKPVQRFTFTAYVED